MAVVDVGVVGVTVLERLVMMRVRMRLAWRIVGTVLVSMVLVVDVEMRMDELFVDVPVLVPFGQVEP